MYHAIIDSDFCKNHYKQRPDNPKYDFESDSEELKNWKEINAFLLNRCDVSVIGSKKYSAEDLAYDNPILLKLCNDYYGGRKSNIDFKKGLTPNDVQSAGHLSTIFLVDTFSLGFSPSEYGMIIYKSKNISVKWIANPSTPKKYLITGEDIIGNTITKWEDIKQFTHQTDSLVISDNYIFRDKKNIRYNFMSLLKGLIPTNSKVEISVTVITKGLYPITPKSVPKEKEVQVDLKTLYKEVSELLREKLPELKINLSIIKKKKNDFHDRGIVTRYFRIELSNSIGFFDKDGNKIGPSDVTFSPEPHIALNGKESYGMIALKQLYDLNRIIESGNCECVNYSDNPLLKLADTLCPALLNKKFS